MKNSNIKKGRLGRLLLALIFLLMSSGIWAQTQVTSPLMTTPAAGDYFSYTGITLSPGFSFTSSAGQSLRLYIADPDCQPLVSLPSANQNYIMTSVPRNPFTTLPGSLSTCDMMQTIAYFDGLGRPLQTVQVKGSPFGKDIVQPVAYDQFSREAVKYLPYASSGTDGSYKATAISDQLNFYHPSGTGYTIAQLPGDIAHIPTPYAQTGFEASPLNRVVEQGAPGDAWQLTGTTTPSGTVAGHTVKVEYTTNNTTTLSTPASSFYAALYTISAIGATDQKRTLALGNGTNNFYVAGQLYVTVSKDENWVSAKGKAGTTEEYKDKEGRVVLKRTFNQPAGSSSLEVLSTYYVYDDLGNLAYVLPPNSGADGGLPDLTKLNALCYQYRYDERNRLTQKKLPGKDWEYIVYNKLDQVVATQDGVQRGKPTPEWAVTRYDAIGRVVMTGLYSYGSTGADVRAALQTLANNQSTLWETPTGTSANYGYTGQSFPGTLNSTLSVNYYDDYRFAGTNPYPYSAGSTMTKSLATGSLTNVLGTGNMLWSVMYYDDKGRNVETFKQHYLGGGIPNPLNYDEISSSYNFNDQVTAVKRKHYTTSGNPGIPVVTIANTYAYDHMGRKIKTMEQIITPTNTGSNILLAKNDYNEIGQLMTKHLHGATGAAPYLQDIDYAYNERGWLSMINNPANAPTTAKLFSEQLNYNVTQYAATAQFNGNIAEQGYKIYNSPVTTVQSVTYAYDALNRLTNGTSSSGLSETGITYDLAGNIGKLARATAPNAANLVYFYNGNQLTSVTNSGANFRGYPNYDLNGNATSDGQGNTIKYNMLNLPESVTSKNLAYIYDASGSKLRKVSNGTTTEYIGGIQYNGAVIDFIQTEEGRAINSAGTYKYEYTLTDHLGNNRVTFDQTNGKVGENDYYPFGLNVAVGPVVSPANKYLYNKKELQDELRQYDYGARFYDPVIGRWSTPDPLAELSRRWSPYGYGLNNPIRNIDVDGMFSTHTDEDGNVLAVYNDGDLGVYKHEANADGKQPTQHQIDKRHKNSTSAGGEKMGETKYWDEFEDPDSHKPEGRINFGESFDSDIENTRVQADLMGMDLNEIGDNSKLRQLFDIKNSSEIAPYGPMTGKLLDGKYATARSAGNYLAGYNGREGTFMGVHISFETYIKLAGALQQGHYNKWNAGLITLFGHPTFGPAPYYGEQNYTGRMVLQGWLNGGK
jgi:RHS repeat-associated protein